MKAIRIIFVFLFLLGIVVPLLMLDRHTYISNLERRLLARPPGILAAGDINWELIKNLPGEIDAYVTDRFAFRSHLISFTKRIDFFILRKSHDNKLLVGKDRWLFYIDKSLGDEFANFKKSNLFDKDQMKIFIEHITLVNDYCETNNIKFIFMIVPTTSSVYPEKYPFPRPKGMSRSGQVIAGLPESIRKKVIFPLDHFLSKKEKNPLPMYYNNGLHWNKLGCYYAYELLYETLKKDFPNIPEIQFNFTPYIDPGEDNYAMLWWGIKNFGKSLVLMNIKPGDGWDSHYTYIKCENVEENVFNEVIGNNSKKGRYGIITENKNQSLPTALVMRDSYFVDLEPFTSSIFSRAEYVWTQPEKRNIQYLIDMPQKPDVFIWEIAERGLEAIPAVKPGEFPFD